MIKFAAIVVASIVCLAAQSTQARCLWVKNDADYPIVIMVQRAIPKGVVRMYRISPKHKRRIPNVTRNLSNFYIRHEVSRTETIDFGLHNVDLQHAITVTTQNRGDLEVREIAHWVWREEKWQRQNAACGGVATSMAYAGSNASCTLYGVVTLPPGCAPPEVLHPEDHPWRDPPKNKTVTSGTKGGKQWPIRTRAVSFGQ